MTKLSEFDITVVVPSFNQGRFLEKALSSVFEQDSLNIELIVNDGGSTDESVSIIKRWEHRIKFWRSSKDAGQSAAINEGLEKATAPFVCWLNSDDWFFPQSLHALREALLKNSQASFAYGLAKNYIEKSGKYTNVWVQNFSVEKLANRCIICQPATLIRKSAIDQIGGLNEDLHMAMDYELWWRLATQVAPPVFVDSLIAVNRDHELTKTNTKRVLHYKEAMRVVKTYYGMVPKKWYLAWPYSVLYRSLQNDLATVLARK